MPLAPGGRRPSLAGDVIGHGAPARLTSLQAKAQGCATVPPVRPSYGGGDAPGSWPRRSLRCPLVGRADEQWRGPGRRVSRHREPTGQRDALPLSRKQLLCLGIARLRASTEARAHSGPGDTQPGGGHSASCQGVPGNSTSFSPMLGSSVTPRRLGEMPHSPSPDALASAARRRAAP